MTRTCTASVFSILIGLAGLEGCSVSNGGARSPETRAVSAAPSIEPSLRASYDGKLASGALWKAEIPEPWNGTLLLFSHGYSPVLREPELAPPGTEQLLLRAGYALAASSYSAPGWALAEAVPDQLGTLDSFISRFGKPKRTIAWGSSMGGLVTVALAEQHPERIDAALPSCGSVAGSLGMMNEALDGAFAFKTLLAADTDIRLVHIDDDRANAARVSHALERAMSSAQGRARVALAGALAQLPLGAGVQPMPAVAMTDKELNEVASVFVRGVFLPRVDQERRAGGNFSWNTGIDYRAELAASGREAWVRSLYQKGGLDLQRDLYVLKAAPRVAAEPQAVAYMRAHYAPSGNLIVPVFSYHTIGDGMTVVEQEAAYRRRVAHAGREAELSIGWVMRSGHCSFSPDEHWAALKTLEDRMDRGVWNSSPAMINARARQPSQAKFGDFQVSPFLRPCGDVAGSCAGEPTSTGISQRIAIHPAQALTWRTSRDRWHDSRIDPPVIVRPSRQSDS